MCAVKRFFIQFCLLAVILTVSFKYFDNKVFSPSQLKLFDYYQYIKPREYTPVPVLIVDIDDESIERIGNWPWPRDVMAGIVDKLSEANPAVIAMDVVFTGEKEHDAILEQSIDNANVVLGFALEKGVMSPVPQKKALFAFMGEKPDKILYNYKGTVNSMSYFEESAEGNAVLMQSKSHDGVVRHEQPIRVIHGQYMPTLPIEALRVAQGSGGYSLTYGLERDSNSLRVGEINIPLNEWLNFTIYYSEPVKERYIPSWKILDGSFDAANLEGKIIFLGSSSINNESDIFFTPIKSVNSSLEIKAQIAEQIIAENMLQRPEWVKGGEITFILFLGAILIIMLNYCSRFWMKVVTISAIGGVLALSWYSFSMARLLLDPIPVIYTVLVIYCIKLLFVCSNNSKKDSRATE